MELGASICFKYGDAGRIHALVMPRGRRVTFTPPLSDLDRAVTIAGATPSPVATAPSGDGSRVFAVEGGGLACIRGAPGEGSPVDAGSPHGRARAAYIGPTDLDDGTS